MQELAGEGNRLIGHVLTEARDCAARLYGGGSWIRKNSAPSGLKSCDFSYVPEFFAAHARDALLDMARS
jgi:hypothetical protein